MPVTKGEIFKSLLLVLFPATISRQVESIHAKPLRKWVTIICVSIWSCCHYNLVPWALELRAIYVYRKPVIVAFINLRYNLALLMTPANTCV